MNFQLTHLRFCIVNVTDLSDVGIGVTEFVFDVGANVDLERNGCDRALT